MENNGLKSDKVINNEDENLDFQKDTVTTIKIEELETKDKLISDITGKGNLHCTQLQHMYGDVVKIEEREEYDFLWSIKEDSCAEIIVTVSFISSII